MNKLNQDQPIVFKLVFVFRILHFHCFPKTRFFAWRFWRIKNRTLHRWNKNGIQVYRHLKVCLVIAIKREFESKMNLFVDVYRSKCPIILLILSVPTLYKVCNEYYNTLDQNTLLHLPFLNQETKLQTKSRKNLGN